MRLCMVLVRNRDKYWAGSGAALLVLLAAAFSVSWLAHADRENESGRLSPSARETPGHQTERETPEPARSGGTIPAPWPMLRHDPQGTSRSPFPASRNPGELLWKFETGAPILSSPAVGSDGSVYFLAEDGRLYALNRTGNPQWVFDLGSPIETYSSPALDGQGHLYLGADRLYALYPDGTLKWTMPGSWGSVIVAPGEILLAYRREGSAATLSAFRPDGSILWTRPRLASGDPAWETPAAGCDGTVYSRDGDGYLHAAYLANGTTRWRVRLGDATSGDNSPAIGGDCTVYVLRGQSIPFEQEIVAVSPEGDVVWRYASNVGSVEFNNLALGPEGTVHFVTSWGRLVTLNRDGTLKWERELGIVHHSTPAISADGILFLGLGNDTVLAVNPDGSTRWMFGTGDGNHFHTTPALGVDGTLYLGSMATVGTSGRNVFYAIGNRTAAANLPPAVAIDAPSSGHVLSGTVVVRGTAYDPDGDVEVVEVQIDAGPWRSAIGTSAWAYELRTDLLADGPHEILARSYDGSAYSSVAAISVTVNNAPAPNPPPVSLVSIFAVALGVAIVLSVVALSVWRSRRRRQRD